jgi:lipoprotein-releasing system permease protein
MTFELLVATRYLRARRKQAVISIITLISVLGVSAGVGALVVAMAVSEGQRRDIQDRLLGTEAHLNVVSARPTGISNYVELTREIGQVEGVVGAAPHAEQLMVISSPGLYGVLVKGIVPELEGRVSELAESVIAGSLADLKDNSIAIGKQLAANLKLSLGDRVRVSSQTTSGSPLGNQPNTIYFTVVAIYEIGLNEYDTRLVYVPLEKASYLMGAGDVATNIEVKVADLDRSEEVGDAILDRIGPGYIYEDWKVTHKSIFQALKLERLGMTIAISLIVFVAALNIVATLTMMVLEKSRDIAILMAMGATIKQIRRIFVWQGVIIGIAGTVIGLTLGHGLSYLADTYKWIELDANVYSISYLPFRADPWDSVAIALAAVLVSFLATLYPSAAAAKLQPVEALRYE